MALLPKTCGAIGCPTAWDLIIIVIMIIMIIMIIIIIIMIIILLSSIIAIVIIIIVILLVNVAMPRGRVRGRRRAEGSAGDAHARRAWALTS